MGTRLLYALQDLEPCARQMREKNRRSRGINYNNEVAFEQRPAPGFYDTASEQATTREVGREFRPTTVEEIEGKRPRVRSLQGLAVRPQMAGLGSALSPVSA